MSYVLSFAGDFLIPDDADTVRPCERAVSVWQAILSLKEETWRAIASDVFGISADRLAPEAVLSKIMETDTCSNLNGPVEVWIDCDGYHSVLVYDET